MRLRSPPKLSALRADPGDAAPHLVVHREQVAARLVDIDEVEDDAVRAGAHQRLGQQRVVGRLVAPPGAAVDENVDRRVLDAAVENVERLDLGRPVGDALRIAEPRARPLARGVAARHHLRAVRRIDLLVVGVVERLLVHVEQDQRTFGVAWRSGTGRSWRRRLAQR